MRISDWSSYVCSSDLPSSAERTHPMNDVSLAPTSVKPAAPVKAGGAFFVETVTWVRHWTESLFSFRTTRDPGLRFASGQFVMVGLTKEDGRSAERRGGKGGVST